MRRRRRQRRRTIILTPIIAAVGKPNAHGSDWQQLLYSPLVGVAHMNDPIRITETTYDPDEPVLDAILDAADDEFDCCGDPGDCNCHA